MQPLSSGAETWGAAEWDYMARWAAEQERITGFKSVAWDAIKQVAGMPEIWGNYYQIAIRLGGAWMGDFVPSTTGTVTLQPGEIQTPNGIMMDPNWNRDTGSCAVGYEWDGKACVPVAVTAPPTPTPTTTAPPPTTTTTTAPPPTNGSTEGGVPIPPVTPPPVLLAPAEPSCAKGYGWDGQRCVPLSQLPISSGGGGGAPVFEAPQKPAKPGTPGATNGGGGGPVIDTGMAPTVAGIPGGALGILAVLGIGLALLKGKR